MADRTEATLKRDLSRLGGELDRRRTKVRKLDRYYEGEQPIPDAVVRARVTRAYKMLMGMSTAPWGALVVDSVLDRLEPSGILDADANAADKLWGIWQANEMDAESKLAHNAALVGGRAFALVWPNPDDATAPPEIWLDTADQMIVSYAPGSRRRRQAAMRHWIDDGDFPHAALYYADGLYKFRGPKGSSGCDGTQWEIEQPDGETWPLGNRAGVVPVVEIPVNRRLKPGTFGYARGDYAHVTDLIDRINLLTFLGLVVAFWLGFPLRGIIGDKITREVLKDDDGNPIMEPDPDRPNSERPATETTPPFEIGVDQIAQLEDPAAKFAEFKEADRSHLSIFDELAQLAAITHTPRHYFPLPGAMSNIAADTIRADEGGMNAKVTGHKASMGGGWLETLRVGGRFLESAVDLSPRARFGWVDRESRSLAEQADAATKLKDVMPWQWIADRVLGMSHDEIMVIGELRAQDPIGQLIAAAATPSSSNGGGGAPAPAGAGAASGNGSGGG